MEQNECYRKKHFAEKVSAVYFYNNPYYTLSELHLTLDHATGIQFIEFGFCNKCKLYEIIINFVQFLNQELNIFYAVPD